MKKTNNNKYLKKWLSAYTWVMSRKTGFVRREFLAANPDFKKAANNLYLRQMVEIGLLVTIPMTPHRYLYVPRAIYVACDHGMLNNACPICAQERKDKIDIIPHKPIEIRRNEDG